MKKIILIVGNCCLAVVLFIILQNKGDILDPDLSMTIISHQETSYEINSNIVTALENDPEAQKAIEYIKQQFEPTTITLTNEYK